MFWPAQVVMLAFGAAMLHWGVHARRPLRALGGVLIVAGTGAVIAAEVAPVPIG